MGRFTTAPLPLGGKGMNEERRIKRLNQHIDTLEKQIEKLKTENEKLKATNKSLLLKIDAVDDVMKEYNSLIEETVILRDSLRESIYKSDTLANDYKRKFNEHLKRIRKQN